MKNVTIAALAIVVLLSAACGTTAAPAATTAPAAATSAPAAATSAPAAAVAGNITIWDGYHVGDNEEKTINQLIDGAKKQFPGATITVLEVPFDQLFNKFETEAATGGGPDMYIAPNDSLGAEVSCSRSPSETGQSCRPMLLGGVGVVYLSYIRVLVQANVSSSQNTKRWDGAWLTT